MITGKIHGGKVTHIHKDGDRTLCGRSVLMAGTSDAPLCKTCKRIAGIQEVSVIGGCRDLPFRANIVTVRWEGAQYTMTGEALDECDGLHTDAPWVASMHEFFRAQHAARKLRASGPRPVERKGDMPKGDGMVNPNSKSVAKGGFAGSPKQFDLIHSLISQINEISAEIYPNVNPLEYTEEYLSSLNTFRKVRSDIDGLFEMLRVLKEKRVAKRAEIRKEESAKRTEENKTNPAEDGYYILGEAFVCVKWNRAGTGQYATTWDGDSWHYDSRASRMIVQDVKAGKLAMMTPDDAKRFGDLYGQCFKCSRTLTDPESIASGYGPVCGGRMGW